jgi:hypothetical protein
MSDTMLKVGELARRAGLTVRTLDPQVQPLTHAG